MALRSSSRNCSIDLFRYFCALLVVNIHANPFLDISEFADTIAVEYVSRIAVPFFFLVAGHFYSQKLHSGERPFKGYERKLLKVYLFWSTIYAVRLIVVNLQQHTFTKDTVIIILKGYLYKGVSEHLWFFPSLMVAVAVLTLAHRLKKEKLLLCIGILLFFLACFGMSYYYVACSNIPVLDKLFIDDKLRYVHRLCVFGISFVALGNATYRHRETLTATPKALVTTATVAFLVLFECEKVAVTAFELQEGLLYTFMLFPLMLAIFVMLLQHPLQQFAVGAKYARNAASFIYYIHPLFIFLFRHFFKTSIPVFFAVCITTTVLSALLTKLNNRHLNFLNS